MAIGSGLSGQLGFGVEGAYGTVAVATRFLELESESLSPEIGRIEAFGIGRGRFLRTNRGKQYIKGAGGDVNTRVFTKGMGLIFKHMLGTHTAAQQAATAEYLHTITPDDTSGLAGLFLTTQVGRPDVTGTVRPFNYEGCKVVSWKIECAVDGELKLMLTLDAETEQTTTALASASFASADDIFIFTQGALTLGGSAISVKQLTIEGSNGLAVDRRSLGNAKKEPLAAAMAEITGQLDFEFEALTRHGYLTAGTEVTNLVATFDTGTVIPSGVGNFKLVISVPLLQITDAPVNVGGAEIVQESVKFKAMNNGTNPVITLAYSTTDTAA